MTSFPFILKLFFKKTSANFFFLLSLIINLYIIIIVPLLIFTFIGINRKFEFKKITTLNSPTGVNYKKKMINTLH